MYAAQMTIGGHPVSGSGAFPVLNPANGQVVGSAPNASYEDLDKAVAAAQKAFVSWSRKTDDELQAACLAVTAKMNADADELATLITLEQGKPLNGLGSRWEMGGAGAWAGYTAGLSLPMKVLQDNEQGRVELHRKPLGVVGSITPWNFPVLIAVWHVLPALRTGNTVVIKPSPLTPLATLRLVELLNEVLPEGVINCVTGDDRLNNLGAAMAAHPGIRKIVFTGSCATGQKVMQSAATTMKRLTLELGGNDAGIVLPDCDPKAIAEGLFWGGFINNGQTCAAMKRLYVHESIHDDVCEHLVAFAKAIPMGDGMSDQSMLGPVQNRMQFEKVAKLVAEPSTLIGFADSGAHIRNMAFYNFALRFLKLVRDAEATGKPVMPLEKAIWRLTGELGNWFGVDAGLLAIGKRADLVVIDPLKLDDSLSQYQEAPMEAFGGLQRMVNRGSAVDCVVINGRIAFADERFAEDLGKTRGYGQFLRAG